jgi:uncharacterized membrane protein
MLPNEIGGIVIGGLPLLLGLFIFAKGAGIETTVNRVVQEMRDNADAAMFSSLLWTATVFSAIFAGAEGWQTFDDLVDTETTSILWMQVANSSLAWIVIAFLTSTAGFMLLRLKRGSFSGQLLVLSIFGMVVYSFVNTALQIAIEILSGEEFKFNVTNIAERISVPIAWIVALWLTMTIVKGLKAKQAQSERYWGI